MIAIESPSATGLGLCSQSIIPLLIDCCHSGCINKGWGRLTVGVHWKRAGLCNIRGKIGKLQASNAFAPDNRYPCPSEISWGLASKVLSSGFSASHSLTDSCVDISMRRQGHVSDFQGYFLPACGQKLWVRHTQANKGTTVRPTLDSVRTTKIGSLPKNLYALRLPFLKLTSAWYRARKC